jgi:hypothetical protein
VENTKENKNTFKSTKRCGEEILCNLEGAVERIDQ